jgi:hypothetical protein
MPYLYHNIPCSALLCCFIWAIIILYNCCSHQRVVHIVVQPNLSKDYNGDYSSDEECYPDEDEDMVLGLYRKTMARMCWKLQGGGG